MEISHIFHENNDLCHILPLRWMDTSEIFFLCFWGETNFTYKQCMAFCKSEPYLLTLLHTEWPKLYGVLAIVSAIGLRRLFSTKFLLKVAVLLVRWPMGWDIYILMSALPSKGIHYPLKPLSILAVAQTNKKKQFGKKAFIQNRQNGFCVK